jgi:hypothetical protein
VQAGGLGGEGFEAIGKDVGETVAGAAEGEVAEAVAEILAPDEDSAGALNGQTGVVMGKGYRDAGARGASKDAGIVVKWVLRREAGKVAKLATDADEGERQIKLAVAINGAGLGELDPRFHRRIIPS